MTTIESVWDLDQDTLSDPEAVLKLVEELWEGDEDSKAVAFDLADGLHWHCVDFHGGQWSPRYSIMCQLGYKPGACEHSPEEGDEERAAAHYVYTLLAEGVGA